MNLDEISQLIKTPLGIFQIIATVLIIFCVFVILIAILIDFLEFHKRKGVKKKQRNIVETGTMFLFFIVLYSVIRFNIGRFYVNSQVSELILVGIGLFLIILGCYVNIIGRFALGKNWANQIHIYKDHQLVNFGVYRFVRHPLYASLIWIFYGASLVYFNYVTLLLTTFIFIPFMYYRAKKEEEMLIKEFKDYSRYKKEVGMFFPKLHG